jgi:hypothetical protein
MFQLYYMIVLTDICRSFLRVSKVTAKIKTVQSQLQVKILIVTRYM